MGWNGSDKKGSALPDGNLKRATNKVDCCSSSANKRQTLRKGLFAGLLVSAIAFISLICIYPLSPNQREVASSRIVVPSNNETAKLPNEMNSNDGDTEGVDLPIKSDVVVTDNVTSVRQTVQMRTLPDGTKEPVSKPYFKNPIDRAFSTLCNPGGMAIPLTSAMRRFSDEEIMRILKSPMEYDKNDSEFILQRKMEMQRLKQEILDYMSEGHGIREALAEADKSIRKDSSYMMMMRSSMREALATKDGEVIREYTKKINEKLLQRGMKGFEVPKQYQLKDEDLNETITEKEKEDDENVD